MNPLRIWAIVPAAGRGARMAMDIPKQYLPLGGRTVIEHTLMRLCSVNLMGVVVVLSSDDESWQHLRINMNWSTPFYSVVGGAERADSVLAGLLYLETLTASNDWVLVHDAARPCLRVTDLERLIVTLADHPVGGLLALPVSDTVKRANAEREILATVPRQNLWRALTPQMFHLHDLRSALATALATAWIPTDESAAMEAAGYRPLLVVGHADNIKITQPHDLILAETFLRAQE